MKQTTFNHLFEAAENPILLQAAYTGVLDNLFCKPFWEAGSTELRRVLWEQGLQARAADGETFGSQGLYLWGIEERPLYLGITRGTFSHRFSRYIWSKRSQCKLAKDYNAALASNGISGFPAEITDWYKKNYGSSKVRLRGAVRFAQEGIDKIWFALFPHDIASDIRQLERKLIPVAEKWNKDKGLQSLLNIEGN